MAVDLEVYRVCLPSRIRFPMFFLSLLRQNVTKYGSVSD
jgi:hypothetical protein